jgi:bifunctional UDP-N-acetylglucosamine pyrophosphorylase/glucosamine-1-phosphate N-acetyltransferase
MSRSPAPTPCATRHAIILAAGESKRTRPLTSHRPKPLIPLLGRPLLAHILDELVGLVDRVTLVVGYRADEIQLAFGESYRGVALRYVLQEQVNGTAGALLAVGQIAEPFFLLYGDNLIAHADVLGVCAQLPSLAGMRVEDARPFGVLQVADGRVLGIIEKPADPPPDALANPGIYHLDAAAFPALARIAPSPRGEYELTDLVGLLAAERRVGYHICTGFWVPVGTPWEALSAAQFLIARRAGLREQISGAAQIGAGSRIVGPAVIGAGCVVGAGCLIEGSCLEPGAIVGDGAVVRHSAIGAGARVGAGCVVESSWLDDGATVGDGASLRARIFGELRPTADTAGLLGREMLCTRGAVLGRGAAVAAGAQVEPGSVLVGR